MAAISNTAEVTASQDETWAKITDLANYGDWMTVHVDYPNGVPESVSEGATFTEKVTIMGMPGEVAWTVKTVEAPSVLEMEGAGPMGTTLRALFKVESNGSGTTLTYETEFGGAALAAMAGPLEKASKTAADDSLAKLKEQLG